MGGSTFTILGAGVGAVGGSLLGNPYLGATMGAQFGGGIDQLNQGYANANAAIQAGQWNMAHRQAIADYNANAALTAANYDASMVMGVAGMNAMTSILGAQMSATGTAMVTAYNSQVALLTSEYNAQLKEQEADLILEASELDVTQYRRVADQAQAAATVYYGASGTVIDEPDSPASMILMDMKVNEELEVAIMRHNADIQVGKVLTAAAQGRWEGQVAAQQIMFEGLTQANLTMYSGMLSGMSTLMGGALQAASIQYGGQLTAHNIQTQGMFDAQSIWQQAQWSASQYKQGGQQAFMNGILNAGASYVNYQIATMPKTAPTTGITSTFAGRTQPPGLYRAPVSNPVGFGAQDSLLLR